jgi:putative serine protease PepD
MTMTFEPFTPAGTPEQGRYDGRRRAEEHDEPPVRVGGDPWQEPPGYGRPRERADWADPGGVETSWSEPRPQARGWTAEPRRPETTWHDQVAVAVAEPEPAPARTRRRAKPLVLGIVVVLLLVAGWEAYRIETMTRHNADLASVLTAEKSRTDRLEQQLAGVFDPEAVSSSVLPSVFRVRAGEFTGTAFSVGRKANGGESNLFTNYHVVAEVWTSGGRKVSLERGTTKIKASIVKVDKGKDLAMPHADQKIAGLPTAGGQVKPGQQVVVVGAPLGLDDTVTTGVISAYRPDDPDGPTIQFDAPINPGNSGGPVVNANEQVVGLATAKAKDAEGIGLAIPIKTACQAFAVC